MINTLMNVLMIFMTLFVIIVFLCGCIVGIGVIDWFLDIDIKGWLNSVLGKRKAFKKIRNELEKLDDTIAKKEIESSGFEIRDAMYRGRIIFPDNVKGYMSKKPSDTQIEDNRDELIRNELEKFKESQAVIRQELKRIDNKDEIKISKDIG